MKYLSRVPEDGLIATCHAVEVETDEYRAVLLQRQTANSPLPQLLILLPGLASASIAPLPQEPGWGVVGPSFLCCLGGRLRAGSCGTGGVCASQYPAVLRRRSVDVAAGVVRPFKLDSGIGWSLAFALSFVGGLVCWVRCLHFGARAPWPVFFFSVGRPPWPLLAPTPGVVLGDRPWPHVCPSGPRFVWSPLGWVHTTFRVPWPFSPLVFAGSRFLPGWGVLPHALLWWLLQDTPNSFSFYIFFLACSTANYSAECLQAPSLNPT